MQGKRPFCNVRRALLFPMILICYQNTLIAKTIPDLNKTEVISAIKLHAAQGDPDSQYLLGILYTTGEVLPKNIATARSWLRKAAEQGDPRAQNCLGLLFDPSWYGTNTPENVAEAARWYRRAASQSYESARYNLNVMKKKRLIADAEPPELLLQRAGLKVNAASSSAPEPARKSSAQIFQEVAPAVVEIIGDGNYGSGVIVGSLRWTNEQRYLITLPGQNIETEFSFQSNTGKTQTPLGKGEYLVVFTNYHVLEGNKDFFLGVGSDKEGETQRKLTPEGACLPVDGGLDLALLFVPFDKNLVEPTPKINFAEIYSSQERPPKGSTVYAVGNPERFVRSISQGLFSGIRDDGLQFNASISHGSSGGALVDESGRLIGLVTAFSGLKESQNLNFAIPYTELMKMLKGTGIRCFSQ
jgi:S1-C subfamily serine protease